MRVALFFGFYEHSGWMVESRLCLPTSLFVSDRESKKMTGALVQLGSVSPETGRQNRLGKS